MKERKLKLSDLEEFQPLGQFKIGPIRIVHPPMEEVFSKEDFNKISFARELAKEAHKGQLREGGERYVKHPEAVSKILYEECQIRDTDIIVAAWLHDVVEDSDFFGDHRGKTYSEWIMNAGLEISSLFGGRVAEMVVAVSRPKVDRVEIKTKKEAHERGLENLRKGSPESILLKMADRLHNLTTLKARVEKKQRKVIKETRREYFPIFRKIESVYPKEYQILMQNIQAAISNVEDSWKNTPRKRK